MDATVLLILLLAVLAGLGVGFVVGVASTRGRLAGALSRAEAERDAARHRAEDLDRDRLTLADQFSSLSAEALARSSRQFLELAATRLDGARHQAIGDLEQRRQAVEHLVAPLQDTLSRVEGRLGELERAREGAYAGLMEQVAISRQTSEQLRVEAAALVTALRAPQTRGRWGELQLRRVVELAGMSARCDYDEQPTATGPDGPVRPDLVVHLAGDKHIVVDSKVPLSAYLEAAEAGDEAVRRQRLKLHARQLRTHVDALGAKSYWAAFTPAPEFVVLFVPGEAFLAPALEHDPQLLEHAMTQRVLIATPTTLVSMLRTVAYAWQQEGLARNAQEVFELGRQLYRRLCTLGEHVDKLGRSVDQVVKDYNKAVGSLEGRVLVTARRLNELDLVEDELPERHIVDGATRRLSAPELLGDDGDGDDPGSRPGALVGSAGQRDVDPGTGPGELGSDIDLLELVDSVEPRVRRLAANE